MSFADYERLGTVVSADGELLQLERDPAGVGGRAEDIMVRGQWHEFRVPGYAVRDLGHGSFEAGFVALADLLEHSDLGEEDGTSPLRMQLAGV